MDASKDRIATLRILDANTNRAREGLRVLEEYARFVLEDRGLCGQLKELRHMLSRTVAALPQGRLVSFRDTPGDVGTTLEVATETRRRNADVVGAAAARLTEALRSLEEYGKIISADFARSIERLRYDSYTITGRLLQRGRGVDFRTAGLYVLLTEQLCSRDWFETASEALAGGARALQLREKQITDCALLERAYRLRELCSRHDAWLIVNDRVDVALAVGADGVHVGQDDMPIREIRRIAGPGLAVGISTHTVEQAERAAGDAPDYLAVGPMFASGTKPQDHVAGPATLDAVRRMTSLPLVAIGGIDVHNAASLQSADVLAVCSAVIAAPDVKAAAARFVETRKRQSPTTGGGKFE